jgi:hypothetical protein
MEAVVKYDGEDFLCRYFFDIDEQTDGIEVYYVPNGNLVGIIDGMCLPDESEAEEVEDFSLAVNMWLGKQDINYTMG